MNEFDTETLNLAVTEVGLRSFGEECIELLKILFPEMNEDKINRLQTVMEETVHVATDIVFRHYYKERQSGEAVKLLLKNNFQWIDDTNLTRLFNTALYYLK